MKKGMLNGSAASTARHSATPYGPSSGRACAAPRPRSSPRAVSGTPPRRRTRARGRRTSIANAQRRRGRRALRQCDHAEHDAAVQVRPRDEEHLHEAPALSRHQDEQGREQRRLSPAGGPTRASPTESGPGESAHHARGLDLSLHARRGPRRGVPSRRRRPPARHPSDPPQPVEENLRQPLVVWPEAAAHGVGKRVVQHHIA